LPSPLSQVARENRALNADSIAAAGSRVGVAHLDWAAPPILEETSVNQLEAPVNELEAPVNRAEAPVNGASPSQGGDAIFVNAQLRCQADVLLAADIINAEGLSEMVENVISLYLAPDGLFLMIAPRPRHRHKIDVLRGLLLGSDTLRAEVVPVPGWLREGIEEAEDIEHELYIVQRRSEERMDTRHTSSLSSGQVTPCPGVGLGRF
jgi:hypothetical protein